MADLNPYEQPEEDEGPERSDRPPFTPEDTGVPRASLRVILGLVVLLAATLGVVVGSAALSAIDRIVPVSWFILTTSAAWGLLFVFVVAGAALGWLAWTLWKKGYPRRRLALIGAAGWGLGLLCLVAIVRSDSAAEDREAVSFCSLLRTQRAAGPGLEERVERCETAYLRCRRSLRQKPGYAEITDDARRLFMNDCLAPSLGGPR